MSLGDLDAFISEREKPAAAAALETNNSPVVRKSGSGVIDNLSGKHSQNPGKNCVWQSVLF